MSTAYDEFKKWKSAQKWETYTTSANRDQSAVNPDKVKPHTYLSSEHVCANCGKRGGDHFSYDGMSWCHTRKEREAFPILEAPHVHTTFSYEPSEAVGIIKNEAERSSNPNKAFRQAKKEEELGITRKSMKKFAHSTAYNSVYASADPADKAVAPCIDPEDESFTAPVESDVDWEWYRANEKVFENVDAANALDLSELPPGTYTIDAEGLTGEYDGITVRIDPSDDAASVTAKIAEKIYGAKLHEMAAKVGNKMNEERSFLEEPKNEGGKDNADE